MAIEVKITGVDSVIRKLGKVEGVRLLEPPMRRAVYRLQARLAQYPAQRSNSRYVRTGQLGRHWWQRVTVGNGMATGEVGNNVQSPDGVRYAPLVQSKRFQSPIHRGRWQTDQSVLDENIREIVRDFQRAIEDALR